MAGLLMVGLLMAVLLMAGLFAPPGALLLTAALAAGLRLLIVAGLIFAALNVAAFGLVVFSVQLRNSRHHWLQHCNLYGTILIRFYRFSRRTDRQLQIYN